ncbi:MAG: hypothetical protein IPI73_02585 [Betaproteobacteria bacterium]|nr:hypothetical protein [Betaproteobacteria bacterium]
MSENIYGMFSGFAVSPALFGFRLKKLLVGGNQRVPDELHPKQVQKPQT